MACELVQGDEILCRDSTGGVREAYIAKFDNVISATATSGQVSTIAMAGGTKFYTYQLEKENGVYTNNMTGSVENGTTFWESLLTFTMKKMSASQKNALQNLSQSRLMVIVKDNNDKYWIMGRTRGADALDIQGTSGQAFGDLNGATVNISGKEPTFDAEFTGTIGDITA